MTVPVREVTRLLAECSDCGWREEAADRKWVRQQAIAHEEQHLASKERCGVLVGRVFSTDAHPEYLGTIYRAAEVARTNGFDHLEFNGSVFAIAHDEIRGPIGWASDVPGFKS